MAQAFRDLVVWQRSMQLTIAVYGLTREFPSDERFGLTSQIRRSAVSVPSNIAEGQGRSNVGEFKQFLSIARGSNYELQTQLELAKALKMGQETLLTVLLTCRTKSEKCYTPSWNLSSQELDYWN